MSIQQHHIVLAGSAIGLLIIALTTLIWIHLICFIFPIALWLLTHQPPQNTDNSFSALPQFEDKVQIKFDKIGRQLSEILKEETDIIHENMERIKTLIHESTEQLHNSFSIVASNTQKQKTETDELVEKLADINKAIDNSSMPTNKPELENIHYVVDNWVNTSKTIGLEINKSIQAIQFEDIVRQLSSGMQCRLDHINEISNTIFPHSNQKHSINYHLDYASGKLVQLRREFHGKRLGEQVIQSSMTEGDIELF